MGTCRQAGLHEIVVSELVSESPLSPFPAALNSPALSLLPKATLHAVRAGIVEARVAWRTSADRSILAVVWLCC